MKNVRKADIKRKTKETSIELKLVIDGEGKNQIHTPLGFFNHLLESFSRHGLFDLELNARGDLETGAHHTVEDLGIVLGQAFNNALSVRKGIVRFGHVVVPMDEALARVVIDLSGRPFFVYQAEIPRDRQWEFDVHLVEEFFRAFANNAGVALHVKLEYGSDYHHCLEAMFKAFGRALAQAVAINPREPRVPSTKEKL